MKRILAPLALFFLIFAYGCVQEASNPACTGLPPGKFENCIYVSAVLEQNPLPCYSIQELVKRERCLRDSTDVSMKKALENMAEHDRASIFVQPQQKPAPNPPTDVDSPAQQNQTQPPNQTSNASNALPPSELLGQAISSKNITICSKIEDSSLRLSCITQISKMLKNLSNCELLPSPQDAEVCRMYSKGG